MRSKILKIPLASTHFEHSDPNGPSYGPIPPTPPPQISYFTSHGRGRGRRLAARCTDFRLRRSFTARLDHGMGCVNEAGRFVSQTSVGLTCSSISLLQWPRPHVAEMHKKTCNQYHHRNELSALYCTRTLPQVRLSSLGRPDGRRTLADRRRRH